MNVTEIKALFKAHKAATLKGRYITNNHIEDCLKNLSNKVLVETIGRSVLNAPIYGLKIGNGGKRILMWSQMHGNESTTTKAIFDLLNTFLDGNSEVNTILNSCTLYIIPILNPDGANTYTRVNANIVDLNRDAQNQTQPESKVLKEVFKSFKPHFCFNLHGQRTIFSAGNHDKTATVSFLAPAQDAACTVTPNRTRAMEIIAVMNNALQALIPNQVGVYDDAFNLNCVGDTFQTENVPTILFEAGHYKQDYDREYTRELIYVSYLTALGYIARNEVEGDKYKTYMDIPENEKLFYDIIIRNAKVQKEQGTEILDIAFQYQERLIDNAIQFVPKVEKMERLNGFFGHKEIDANRLGVLTHEYLELEMGYENDFVIINNEKTTLKLN